ncbi:response regulator transcription factor [uncultured Rikenella sp.]|uniref:response regulator transcription factor n=2 Tax=uncultured Rikenella sp. TaxID=368003 RepID=UPI0025DEF0CE|nr:response regulator transcription factor [uncultured Rikenella sp.]
MNDRMNKKIRLAIIEPSAVIAAGLQTLLTETSSEFELCALFDEPGPLLERAPILRPDLILIDPVVIDFRRRAALHPLFEHLPEAAWVAVVYGFIEPEALKQYHGAIHIYDDRSKIVRKLRRAVEERARDTESPSGENYELTDREREILVAVAKGMTNKEIADTHHISVHTVISHRKNISRKTGIKTVSGLTVYALLNNLLDQSEIE